VKRLPANPKRLWHVTPNVRHTELGDVLNRLETAGHVIVTIIPAGESGCGAYATIVSTTLSSA
jgi:hypothetical protein